MNMYILDMETKKIKKATYEEWSAWIKTEKNKIIKRTEVEKLVVSTVFLSSDHNFDQDCNGDNPILFETMIFSDLSYGSALDYQKRYSTYEEAMQGHFEAIVWAKEHIAGKHNQGYEFENGPVQFETPLTNDYTPHTTTPDQVFKMPGEKLAIRIGWHPRDNQEIHSVFVGNTEYYKRDEIITKTIHDLRWQIKSLETELAHYKGLKDLADGKGIPK